MGGDHLAMGYAKQIRERIEKAKDGTIFIHADFVDIAEAETVRRTLNRLVFEQVLKHLLNGIYEKPRYSELLQEFVAPDPNEVAKALARNYHWSIAPSGNTALNLLGLSTQVAAVWSYRSDGPYKTYQLNDHRIEFKHRTNKEVSGLSDTTALVIQALKELGRDHIDPSIIETISSRLSNDDRESMLCEASESTDWIYDMIRKICERGPSPSFAMRTTQRIVLAP
jgi:hypothetical protein